MEKEDKSGYVFCLGFTESKNGEKKVFGQQESGVL